MQMFLHGLLIELSTGNHRRNALRFQVVIGQCPEAFLELFDCNSVSRALCLQLLDNLVADVILLEYGQISDVTPVDVLFVAFL